jgi:four helix bundle protein
MAGRDFEELDVYKVARQFRNEIYAVVKSLPDAEKFALASQMRRAAVPVTNNIAEGHGTFTFKQNVSYLHTARGSVYELRDDLNVCQDQGYLDETASSRLRDLAVRLTMVMDGYVRYLRSRDAAKA